MVRIKCLPMGCLSSLLEGLGFGIACALCGCCGTGRLVLSAECRSDDDDHDEIIFRTC